MAKIYKVYFRDKSGIEHEVSYFGSSEKDVRKLFYSIKRKGDELIKVERIF